MIIFFKDVHEAIDRVLDELEKEYNTKIDYPVAEFIIVLGFFIVLIIEQVVLEFKEKWKYDIKNVSVNASNINTSEHVVHEHAHHADESSCLLRNSGDPILNSPTEGTSNRRKTFVDTRNRPKNYGTNEINSDPIKRKSLDVTEEIVSGNNNDISR